MEIEGDRSERQLGDTSIREYQFTLANGWTHETFVRRCDGILREYDEEIGRAKSDEEKRFAIARAVQSLYRAQFFNEGPGQPTVFMIMQRMLLDAGLSPSILDAPEQAFALSVEDLAAAIAVGQNTFRTRIPTKPDPWLYVVRSHRELIR
jgi:hypothetical protein